MLVYPNKIKAHALLQVLHITNCTNVDLSSIVENAFLAQNYPSEWMSKLNDCTCEFLKIINQSIPTDEQSSTDFNAPQTVNEQWLMKGVDEEITVSCTDYQTSEEKWATKDLKED